MPEFVPYTLRQNRQREFISRFEPYETLSSLRTYWVDCYTCNEDKTLHSVDGTRSFIANHRGHSTWVQVSRSTQNPLTMS